MFLNAERTSAVSRHFARVHDWDTELYALYYYTHNKLGIKTKQNKKQNALTKLWLLVYRFFSRILSRAVLLWGCS